MYMFLPDTVMCHHIQTRSVLQRTKQLFSYFLEDWRTLLPRCITTGARLPSTLHCELPGETWFILCLISNMTLIEHGSVIDTLSMIPCVLMMER